MSFKTRGPVLTNAAQSTGTNPSNDGSSPNNYTPDYTAAGVFAQQTSFSGGIAANSVLANIPAGSNIDDIQLIIDAVSAQGAGSVNISLGGVVIAAIAIPAITANSITTLKIGNGITYTAGQGGLISNTGTTNKQLTIATVGFSGTITTYVSTRFTVRYPDGSITPGQYNLTN